jgi:2-hydroxychromene-2-carboxylate isomerase
MFSRRFIRTLTSETQQEMIKFYYDFKSPYTYLAFEPTLELEKEYHVQLRFIPWPFRPEESFGGNLQERNKLNWNKVRYLYLDCRRFANERGMTIRGPERLFDSRLSLIGGLYADKNGFFRPYARRTFERFFNRQLNLENIDEITKLLYETSKKNLSLEKLSEDFQTYVNNQGQKDYLDAENEADQDKIFGVPTLMIRGEPFWGNDRILWVKKKLDSLQLRNT